jgi:hypothetical protein
LSDHCRYIPTQLKQLSLPGDLSGSLGPAAYYGLAFQRTPHDRSLPYQVKSSQVECITHITLFGDTYSKPPTRVNRNQNPLSRSSPSTWVCSLLPSRRLGCVLRELSSWRASDTCLCFKRAFYPEWPWQGPGFWGEELESCDDGEAAHCGGSQRRSAC